MLDKVTTGIARLFIGVGNKISVAFGRTTHVKRTVRVERSPREVYAFWRDLNRLAKAAHSVAMVEVRDTKRSRWTVSGPLGLKLIWSAELIADEPNRRIAWRTISPTDLPHTGQVLFRSIENGRATEVAIDVDYRMPLGPVGDFITWLLRSEGPTGFVASTIAQVKRSLEKVKPVRPETQRRVQVPRVPPEVSDTAMESVVHPQHTFEGDHKSRAARAAESKHLLDLAKGPPAAPTSTAPKKNGRHIEDGGDLLFDRRARQRTQH